MQDDSSLRHSRQTVFFLKAPSTPPDESEALYKSAANRLSNRVSIIPLNGVGLRLFADHLKKEGLGAKLNGIDVEGAKSEMSGESYLELFRDGSYAVAMGYFGLGAIYSHTDLYEDLNVQGITARPIGFTESGSYRVEIRSPSLRENSTYFLD